MVTKIFTAGNVPMRIDIEGVHADSFGRKMYTCNIFGIKIRIMTQPDTGIVSFASVNSELSDDDIFKFKMCERFINKHADLIGVELEKCDQ
jgi:hypothetical protein